MKRKKKRTRNVRHYFWLFNYRCIIGTFSLLSRDHFSLPHQLPPPPPPPPPPTEPPEKPEEKPDEECVGVAAEEKFCMDE